MSIIAFGEHLPVVDATAFVAPSADVIGRVELGPGASVWFNAVLRGDMEPIRIGARTNIQDGCIVHVDAGEPCTVGKEVTVGHNVILHACTVEDGALIGMGSTILNGAVIGEEAFIAAGSLVTPGTIVPPRTMFRGAPAKEWKPLPEDQNPGREGAGHYAELATRYRNQLGT